MRALAFVVVMSVILISTPAAAYSCDQIRTWHREYGTVWLIRKARELGLNAAQIKAGIACLRYGRNARNG